MASHGSRQPGIPRPSSNWEASPLRRSRPCSKAPGIIPALRPVPRVNLISAEPHMPHVLMEKGDMTLGEFDQHLKGRTDFIKGTKKDSSAGRKVRVTEAKAVAAELGWHGDLVFARPVRRLSRGRGGNGLPQVTGHTSSVPHSGDRGQREKGGPEQLSP